MSTRGTIPEGATRLDWANLELAIFDVDGTLYDAAPLRRKMLQTLLLHCALHPTAIADVRILRRFRICRETLAREGASQIGRMQYDRAARQLGVDPERVETVVRTWMYERPLEYLRSCRFPGIEEVFAALRGAGIGIAILSDYPAVRKLEALGLEVDIVVTALDPEVDRLKPAVRGLERVLGLTGSASARSVFIGDREDTDGTCARRAGVPFLRKVTGVPAAEHEFSDYRWLAREMQTQNSMRMRKQTPSTAGPRTGVVATESGSSGRESLE